MQRSPSNSTRPDSVLQDLTTPEDSMGGPYRTPSPAQEVYMISSKHIQNTAI